MNDIHAAVRKAAGAHVTGAELRQIEHDFWLGTPEEQHKAQSRVLWLDLMHAVGWLELDDEARAMLEERGRKAKAKGTT